MFQIWKRVELQGKKREDRLKQRFIHLLKKKLKTRYREEKLESKLITFQSITKPNLQIAHIFRDFKLNAIHNKVVRRTNRIKARKYLKAFRVNVILNNDGRAYDNLLEQKCTQFILAKYFCTLKEDYLQTRYRIEQARMHGNQTYVLRYMKLLWINTIGLKKINEKRAI